MAMYRDFYDFQQFDGGGPCVVWLRWGNMRKAALIGMMTSHWPDLLEQVDRGARLVELDSWLNAVAVVMSLMTSRLDTSS